MKQWRCHILKADKKSSIILGLWQWGEPERIVNWPIRHFFQSSNKKRFDIEEKCIQLTATQQPMASDLRMIICVLNIISELERIGDHAEGIAKIVIMIGDEPPLKPLIDLPRMAEKTNEMLLMPFVKRSRHQSVATVIVSWLSDLQLRIRFRNPKRRLCYDRDRSKRSRFMTLFHAATKWSMNFSKESPHA